jgi:type I restriction enzyme S subunit
MFDGTPQGWEQTTLGAIAGLGGGTTPSKADTGYWDDGSIPWATPSDITSLPLGESQIRDTTLAVSERAMRECSLPLNPPGTILMTSRATIGFAAINNVPMATNQGFITFRCNEKSDPYFLYQWLIANRNLLVSAAGGSTFKEISRGTAKLLPILLPPLDEQRQIAEVLRSVDEAISASAATVSAAISVRQFTLDALIKEQIDAADVATEALSSVAEIRTGLAKNKNASGRHVQVPYLRVANVQDGWFDLSDMQQIDVQPDKVARYSLQAGDVLLTEGGDYDKLGRGGVWKAEVQPCLHQNHIFCVRPNPEFLLSDFLALITQSFLGRSYFLSCAKRTTNLASINSSQLKALPLPVPDIQQQMTVVEEIGSIDALILHEEEKLASLQRLGSSLASDLLSGRVRVPV